MKHTFKNIYVSIHHFVSVETKEEFKATMDKIPDYRIREEDVTFTID